MQATDYPFFANVMTFSRLLRRAGIAIALDQTLACLQALALVDIGERAQVYYALRGLLVNRKEDIQLFDALFNRFWRASHVYWPPHGRATPSARTIPAKPPQPALAVLLAQKAGSADPEVDVADRSGTFSATEQLQAKDFAQMSPAELAAVRQMIQQMTWRLSQRRTRRLAPDRAGARLDLRRMMRHAAKHNGLPWQLAWQSRKIKPRPIVILADISGSMEKYSRLLLQFCYSVARAHGDLECFLFGTRLTRVTRELRLRNVDQALAMAGRTAIDWSGGTRIGASLQIFNQTWSRRVLRRGAVVLIISDGWERGDVERLRREMRYLHHRCYRLIWLNPRLGQVDYQPLVEGMAAALPFVDDFMPVHNFQSLAQLADHLAALSRRPGQR